MTSFNASYRIEHATPSLRGFDCNTKLTSEKARQFYQTGYRFCIRYVSRLENESYSDLTTQEVEDIIESGLALMPVQHVQRSGWMPSAALGQEYGLHAANHANAVGFISGVNVWLDLEGVSSNASAQEVVAYCQSWYREVKNAGYEPGLYVGARDILTGEQLYNDLSYSHYWKSLSRVPDVAHRGYQLVQHPTVTVNGIEIDEDTTQDDNLGGSAIWMVK